MDLHGGTLIATTPNEESVPSLHHSDRLTPGKYVLIVLSRKDWHTEGMGPDEAISKVGLMD